MIDTRIDPPDDVFAWADGVGGSATVLAAHTLDPDVDVVAPALAGRVWGLLTQTRAGRGPIDLSGPLREAALAARGVGVAAFPAIACATLARSPKASPLEIRARLFLAVLRGRL